MRSEEEIADAFRHHPPSTPEVIAKHEGVRAECHALAQYIFRECPPCAETTLAIRNVEQAMFYANAAIARNCNS